jgi:general stress protein 26
VEVATFEELQEPFDERVARIAWASVTTIDRRGRPRVRILHPIWEGSTGWIATGRQSFKAKHLAEHPYISICYWDPQHEQVYVEAHAEWDDDMATKRRIWDLYKETPPPLGYDPGIIWPSVEHESFGLLKLTPWRVEISSLSTMAGQGQVLVWHSDE